MITSQQRGQAAEDRACEYLQAQGFQLITRNYRLRGGEIDLIGHDNECLVLVEVRYRHSEQFGGALQSIDFRKQQRIIRTAQHYLMHYPVDLPCRFDVIALDQAQQITWIKNAFET